MYILLQQEIAKSALPPVSSWRDSDIWIPALVSLAGLVFSVLAWVEARQAKVAAEAAGRTVKLQTVAIELSEVGQRLDRVQPGIRFNEARDLLADVSRRLHRATSPFLKDADLTEAIQAALDATKAAQESLKDVRPEPGSENTVPDSVYYGIEAVCSTVSNGIADLIGLFEKKAFDLGR